MKKLVAISTLVFFSCLLPAAAKQSTGHMTVTEVEVSCINHSGTVTAGSGKGGYGCNYPSGNKTSCNAKGNCTFTSPDTHKGGITNNVRTNGAVASPKMQNSGNVGHGPSPGPLLETKQPLTTTMKRQP